MLRVEMDADLYARAVQAAEAAEPPVEEWLRLALALAEVPHDPALPEPPTG